VSRGNWPTLSSLLGDPTLRLSHEYAPAATALVAPGCVDVTVSWESSGDTSLATISRALDEGPYVPIATDVPGQERQGVAFLPSVGMLTDPGLARDAAGRTARYEVTVQSIDVTNRGSTIGLAAKVPTGPQLGVPLTCRFTCAAADAVIPGNINVEGPARQQHLRSRLAEVDVVFGAGGTTVELPFAYRPAGVEISGARADQPNLESRDSSCPTGLEAAAYVHTGLVPGHEYVYTVGAGMHAPFGGANRLRVGYGLSARHDEGRVIVVAEDRLAGHPVVAAAIVRYERALVADGWEPVQLVVGAGESPVAVRDRLRTLHAADPDRTRAAVLIGHVPVPYSGRGFYDGHPDHAGAWATDAYYMDLDGTWTDATVNIPANPGIGLTARNANVPGDGKFDHERLPSSPELAVGRIDFFNMPSLAADVDAEAALVAEYLDRSVAFRAGEFAHRRQGFTIDRIYGSAGEMRTVSPVVGSANVVAGTSRAAVDQQIASDPRPYLIAQTNGFGWYQGSSGVGTTTDTPPALFVGSLGSYYGDWDTPDNYLRGHLTRSLGATWEGFPTDRAALGGTIGETIAGFIAGSTRSPLPGGAGRSTRCSATRR
jgi:hypothetical protein